MFFFCVFFFFFFSDVKLKKKIIGIFGNAEVRAKKKQQKVLLYKSAAYVGMHFTDMFS